MPRWALREHKLPLLVGLPDDMLVPLTVNPRDGSLSWSVPGNTSFPSQLAPEFRQRMFEVFFGPHVPLMPTASAQGVPVANVIGDPDTSAISLRMVVQLLETTRAACFNHPRAVLGSGRERVAQCLARVAGLQVPRTIKIRISEPDDFLYEASSAGLVFPLIVRIAGIHGGAATVKIDAPEDTKIALRAIPWGGRELYLTEFVDYRDADGRYRKLRLIVVGKQVFLRHLIVTDQWHVHAQERDNAASLEEIAALENFYSELRPKVEGTLLEVAELLQLDFFGMDCSLRPDGRLLMFETNASMNVLYNSKPSPNYWDAPIREIHDAAAALLFDPARWRFPGYPSELP